MSGPEFIRQEYRSISEKLDMICMEYRQKQSYSIQDINEMIQNLAINMKNITNIQQRVFSQPHLHLSSQLHQVLINRAVCMEVQIQKQVKLISKQIKQIKEYIDNKVTYLQSKIHEAVVVELNSVENLFVNKHAVKKQLLKQNKFYEDMMGIDVKLSDIKKQLNNFNRHMPQFKFEHMFSEQAQSQIGTDLYKKQRRKMKRLPVKIKEWVDPECYFIGSMDLQDNRVCNMSGKWLNPTKNIYIVGSKRCDKKYSYGVVFQKIEGIARIGVIDSTLKSVQKLGHQSSRNCIYYCNDGIIDVDCSYLGVFGPGFKAQDVVQVYLNTNAGIIQWMVNGYLVYAYQSLALKDGTVVWVPFIQLPAQDDSVVVSQ